MATVAERQGTFAAAFETLRATPAFAGDAARADREAAFARFTHRGFPTTRDEEWKFTNVTPIANAGFEPAAAAASIDATAVEPFLFPAGMTAQIVLVNGRLSTTLSSLTALPAGVTVRTGTSLRGGNAHGLTAFADLNAAVFAEGLVIAVAAKTVVGEPIHVLSLVVPVGTAAMASPRVFIDAGEQAEFAIVETHASLGGHAAFVNTVTDVHVGAGAIVNHVKIEREGDAVFHLANIAVRVERAGAFDSRALTFGGRIVRNDIVATLDGEGATCTLDGLYVGTGETLIDTHTTIDHAKAHCPSHEVYKGILGGRAKAVFNGKIIVRQDAQKTDAKQTNKALLLTDDAQINTKPQLEIFADDVKCTHGAAIGQLDEDAMFYMRARGIDVDAARNMLIHAFAGQVLDGIQSEAVRDVAVRLMEDKLNLAHQF